MLRSNHIVIFAIIAAGVFMVQSQQYVPIQILVPVNSSYPLYVNSSGYRPPYNYSINGTNSTDQNTNGSSYITQFPGYNVSVPTNYNATQDGHLFVGLIQYNDKLLFNQTYRRERSWFGSREVTLTYPPGESSRFEVISAIRIYNRFLDGASCRATVLKGGIGSQYVKIKLSSKWRKGFLYNVQIFGH